MSEKGKKSETWINKTRMKYFVANVEITGDSNSLCQCLFINLIHCSYFKFCPCDRKGLSLMIWTFPWKSSGNEILFEPWEYVLNQS